MIMLLIGLMIHFNRQKLRSEKKTQLVHQAQAMFAFGIHLEGEGLSSDCVAGPLPVNEL